MEESGPLVVGSNEFRDTVTERLEDVCLGETKRQFTSRGKKVREGCVRSLGVVESSS